MLHTLGRQGRKHSRHAADSRAGRQEDSQDMLQTDRQPGKDTVKLGHHHQGYQRAGKWHMEGLRAVGFSLIPPALSSPRRREHYFAKHELCFRVSIYLNTQFYSLRDGCDHFVMV